MSSSMEIVKELFVVSHTHWDREWYRTFQEYRLQLVSVIDQLLELMRRQPEFEHFLLDGQTIVLEDYLALRPERVAEVRRLACEGRLAIGPWYVQPDEFLVSGEALIRNLLFGRQMAEPLGGAAKVGWLPDTFGHIAQLPQVLRNFDIDNFIFSRGIGDEALACPSAAWWCAPNGARVLALHQLGGYWNAGNLGHPCFWGEAEREAADPERALQTIRELIAALDPAGQLPALAVWNGADHTPAQSDLPEMIGYLNEHLGDYHVRHGSIVDYLTALQSDGAGLSTLEGELRGSRYQPTPASTLSSRVYLKQANHRAQRLLQDCVEPLSALAWVLGGAYPAAELREAWRLLLVNHSHDSVCGCSIDPVYHETTSRFEQVEQIGDALADRGAAALGRCIDTAWCDTGQAPVLVFNSLPYGRREAAQVTLRLPDSPRAFCVADARGQVGPAQVIARRREQFDWIPQQATAREVTRQMALWRKYLRDLDGVDIVRHHWRRTGEQRTLRLLLGDRHLASEHRVGRLLAEVRRLPAEAPVHIEAICHAISLAFQVEAPALGHAVCAVAAGGPSAGGSAVWASGQRAIENEHLRLEVEQGGSLTLLHKETGGEYRGLHTFEDAGDVGDAYDFCAPPGPDGTCALCSEPTVALIEAGPIQATLRVHSEFKVPEALTTDRQARSVRRVALPITSLIRLRAGSPYVEITTTLDNRARDHRLRVLFPTGLSSQCVHAGGHFATASRPVSLPPGKGWVQPPSGLQPHQAWFAVDDAARGLAILSEGLPEHEALPTAGGLTLALTLLRGVGWLSRGDLPTRNGQAGPAIATPGAQCLGTHAFRYGILTYAGAAARPSLPRIAAVFDNPLITRPASIQPGKLAPWHSFLSVEPEALVFSAFKRSEAGDRLALRFYNAAGSGVTGRLRFDFPVSEAWQATAAEVPTRPIPLDPDRHGCELDVGPFEIVTLLLSPA
jgi:alpha-mannosidase